MSLQQRDRDLCSVPAALARHVQPPAHLLFGLRPLLPDRLELRAQIGRQSLDAVVVELDEVPGSVADVELHDVAGKVDEAVAERLVVERVAPLRGSVDGLYIVRP